MKRDGLVEVVSGEVEVSEVREVTDGVGDFAGEV